MTQKKPATPLSQEDKFVMPFILAFFVWCPTYLFLVRPMFNAWVAPYMSTYPAMLHLIPILGPFIIVGSFAAKHISKAPTQG